VAGGLSPPRTESGLRGRIVIPVFLLALALAAPGFCGTLRVATFTVRFPSPDDRENVWEKRRDLLVETIRDLRADILGTQELYKLQGDYITSNLPQYAWFGIGRYGNQDDEHTGVFYLRDKFRVLESGDFWLSEMPNRAGSRSWDITLPRVATWAKFEELATGKTFYVFNTHFPHRPQDDMARLHCSRLLRARLAALPADAPVVLTGDFNARASGMAYGILAGVLKDAWTTAVKRTGPEGTFHSFQGLESQSRIDWILYRGFRRSVRAETVTRNADGKYPSDHYPVIAELEF